MKARIVILPDGQISIFTDEGTLESGKLQIESILSALQASGLEFSEIGQVEQHKHAHEHAGEHAHNHSH